MPVTLAFTLLREGREERAGRANREIYVPICNRSRAGTGTGPFFGELSHLATHTLAENTDLSPSLPARERLPRFFAALPGRYRVRPSQREGEAAYAAG